jgi:hypothetical protein
MSQELAEEQLIRSYFLGDLPESEQERILERLFTDQLFFETLLVIEGELIDDYALGLVSDQEREKLETGFLRSPHEYLKIEIVKALAQYITNNKGRSSLGLQSFAGDWLFTWLSRSATPSLVAVIA